MEDFDLYSQELGIDCQNVDHLKNCGNWRSMNWEQLAVSDSLVILLTVKPINI